MIPTTGTRPSPLLQELQQGRKMRSLNELMAKLDEDQRRHTIHTHSVKEGLNKILNAQAPANTSLDQRPSTAPDGSITTSSIVGRDQFQLGSKNVSNPTTPSGSRSRVEEFREEVYEARKNYPDDEKQKSSGASSKPLSAPEDLSKALSAGTCKFDPPAGGTASEQDGLSTGAIAVSVATPGGRGSDLVAPHDNQALALSAGTCKFPVPDNEKVETTEATPVMINVPSTDRASLTHASPVQVALAQGAGTCKFDPPPEERKPSKVGLGTETEGFAVQAPVMGGNSHHGQIVVVSKPANTRATIALKGLHGLDDKKVTMKLNKKEEQVKLKHNEEVLNLAFSKSGSYLVACDEEGSVVLWDVANQTQKMSQKMDGPVQAVAYSPDDQYVAGGGEDPYVVIWSTKTCEEEARFAVDHKVLSLAFAPKSDMLAIGDVGKKVTLISIPAMEAIAEFAFDGDVRSLSFNSESMLAGGGGADPHHGLMNKKSTANAGYGEMKTVVWNVSHVGAECKYLGSITFSDIVKAVAFSPSDRWLAVGSEDKMISLLSVDKEFEKVLELPCAAGVTCLGWSSDSRFLATGGEDMKISMWDIILRQMIFQLPKVTDWYCAVAFHPNMGSFAACCFSEPNVKINYVDVTEVSLNKEDEEAEGDDNDEPEPPAINPPAINPPAVAVPVAPIGVVAVTNVDSGAQTKAEPEQKSGSSLLPAQKSDKDRTPSRVDLGTESEGFHIKVEAVGAGAGESVVMLTIPQEPQKSVQSSQKLVLSTKPKIKLSCGDEVLSMAYSPDGLHMISGGENETAVLWEVATQTKKMEKRMSGPIMAAAYAPNNQYVAAGGQDSFVVLWNATTYTEEGAYAHEGHVLSLAFSPDSQMLAVGDTKKKVTLLSLPQMEEIAELQHDGDVRSLSFSPDGKMLAGGGGTDPHHGLMTNKTGNNYGEMKTVVWAVSTSGDDCKYLGSIVCKDVVHSVKFSPDGQWLAVGSEDKTIALLSVENNFEKTLELGCAAGVLCLAWSHDSRFLASGGEDMKITMWDLQKSKMIFQLPKAQDWYSCVVFHPSMDAFATCGFSDNSVTIHAIQLEDVAPPKEAPPAPPVKVKDDDHYSDEDFEPDPDEAADDPEPVIAVAPPLVISVGSS